LENREGEHVTLGVTQKFGKTHDLSGVLGPRKKNTELCNAKKDQQGGECQSQPGSQIRATQLLHAPKKGIKRQWKGTKSFGEGEREKSCKETVRAGMTSGNRKEGARRDSRQRKKPKTCTTTSFLKKSDSSQRKGRGTGPGKKPREKSRGEKMPNQGRFVHGASPTHGPKNP